MRFVLRSLRRYRQFDLADMKLPVEARSFRPVSFRKNFVWKSRTAPKTFKNNRPAEIKMTFPYSKKHCFVGHELQPVYEPESVCGDLVPSLEAGKPKDRVSRITEGENSRSRAEGNRREAYLFGWGFEAERAFRRVKTMRR